MQIQTRMPSAKRRPGMTLASISKQSAGKNWEWHHLVKHCRGRSISTARIFVPRSSNSPVDNTVATNDVMRFYFSNHSGPLNSNWKYCISAGPVDKPLYVGEHLNGPLDVCQTISHWEDTACLPIKACRVEEDCLFGVAHRQHQKRGTELPEGRCLALM